MRKVLFASWHNYLDASNGASVSTRALLVELARRAWDVSTFCALGQDYSRAKALDSLLASHNLRAGKTLTCPEFTTTSFLDFGVKSLVYSPKENRRTPSNSDVDRYMALFVESLKLLQPEIVLTYGGYNLARPLLREARRCGAKTAVFLHNLAYNSLDYFNDVDLVFVPSHFAADYYRRALGLETVVVPPLIASQRLEPAQEETSNAADMREYALFVNPEEGKGARFLIALAKELWRLRPDVRFLVLEGREGRNTLLRLGRELLRDVGNIYYARNVTDVHRFYKRARVTLFPSLYEETFGRVPAESLNSGAPVIASDRGAIPEVVGQGGVIIRAPDKFQPDAHITPNSDEIMPWVQALTRLWDDREFYTQTQRKGFAQSALWRYERVADLYDERLTELIAR